MTRTLRLPQELIGTSVSLNPFDASCITDQYVSWLRDPQVVRFSNQRFREHTRESCVRYLDSFAGTSNLFLAIRTREDARMVGTMTAYVAAPHGTADMGILIGDRGVWGRGVGGDAWNTLLAFLLGEGGLRKVTGGTLRCNLGMVRVMERSGMYLEAVRARQEIIEGIAQDVLYYAKFADA